MFSHLLCSSCASHKIQKLTCHFNSVICSSWY